MNLGFYDSFGQGKPCAEEDPKRLYSPNKNGSGVLYWNMGLLVTHIIDIAQIELTEMVLRQFHQN